MKKTILMLTAVLALFLVGCAGSAPTPSEAAVKVYEMVIDGNYEGVAKSFYFGEKSAEEVAQAQAMIQSLFVEKAGPQIESKGGLKSVEALNETIAEDGQSAKVEVKLTYGNGTEENAEVDMVLDSEGNWRPSMNK